MAKLALRPLLIALTDIEKPIDATADGVPFEFAPDAWADCKNSLHERIKIACVEDERTGCVFYEPKSEAAGAWGKDGYGRIKVDAKSCQLHRVVAWIYLGGFDLWDRTVKVLHLCQHPACIALPHLLVVRRTLSPNGEVSYEPVQVLEEPFDDEDLGAAA